jgi:hypothetical protein
MKVGSGRVNHLYVKASMMLSHDVEPVCGAFSVAAYQQREDNFAYAPDAKQCTRCSSRAANL